MDKKKDIFDEELFFYVAFSLLTIWIGPKPPGGSLALGKPQKTGIFLVARREGEGVRAWPLKKTFFEALKKCWKNFCGR